MLIGWIANKPLSLLYVVNSASRVVHLLRHWPFRFDPLEVVTLFLSVLLVRFATEDGRTHYMSGILLFGTYVLIVSALLESFPTMPLTPNSPGIFVLVLPPEWY